jgi:hypothetical protein
MPVPAIKVDVFLDRPAILKALDKKRRRVLGRTGSYPRQIVRRSMRSGGKKNRVSDPGQPPRWHTKKLRNSIRFGYDSATDSVVIGALPYRSPGGGGAAVLEEGGTVTITTTVRGKRTRKRVRVKPRPYIGPNSINHPKAMEKLRELTRDVPLE